MRAVGSAASASLGFVSCSDLFTERSFTLFMSFRISSMLGRSVFFELLLTGVFPAEAFFSLRSFIRSRAEVLCWSPGVGGEAAAEGVATRVLAGLRVVLWQQAWWILSHLH